MKVLWVNPSFLDYRVPLYQELNEQLNGDFHILFSKNRIPERVITKVEEALGANSHGLEGERFFNLGKQGEFSNEGVQIPFQQGLLKAIKEIKPDIVIAEGFFQWTPLVTFYAKTRNIPFWIAYERTYHTERSCPTWRKKYRALVSYFADGYLANGKLTLEYLRGDINAARKPIIEGCMSADGSNLSSRVKSIPRTPNQEKEANLTYLYVGQLIHRKGILELCEAWIHHVANYEGDTLLIIGDGELKAELENSYADTDSIQILGAVDYDQIHEYYASADVFVMPTLEDNWSLVVPEAMACGLPVATTYYNGCYPELVHDGVNGKVFDSLHKESIIDTLGYFHSQNLQEMGEASIRIESDYSPEKVAARIVEGILFKK